jgi:hypothetical protein
LETNTGCSYGQLLDLTHTSCVVYLLASAAGEVFKGHSHRLSRVTAAVSYCYYLAPQSKQTLTGLGYSAQAAFTSL